MPIKKRNIHDWQWKNHELIVEVAEEHKTDRKHFHLDLTGIYQTKNLLTVLEACSLLHDMSWKTDESIIQKALPHVKKLTGLHGRWEIIHHNPVVALDVGHNEDGIKQIVQQLELTPHKNLHIILGMVKDKEIDKVLSLLPKSAEYYFTQAAIPRALDAEALKAEGEKTGLGGKTFSNVNIALKEAMAKTDKEDLILVCGSVFLVGEVNKPPTTTPPSPKGV